MNISQDMFNIHFVMEGDTMKINLNIGTSIDIGSSEDEMGLIMIRALMDNLTINTKENKAEISMIKKHRHISFE